MCKGNLRKRILFANVVLVLILGLTLLLACGSNEGNQTTSVATKTPAFTPTPTVNKYGGTLKILFPFTPRPNFGYNTELAAMNIPQTQYALETLIQLSDKGVATPWLATSWEVAPDKKSVTIHLREGVKFHDGSDFNAEALVWNIDRVVANGGSYHLEWGSGEVINNYTVKLNLKNYSNRLPLSLARITITSPTAYKTKGAQFAEANPIGTGPFKFVEYKKDQLLRFERNPDYWQKGLPYLDGIEIIYIADAMTRKAAFENGEGHLVYEIKNELRMDLEKKGYLTPEMPAYGGELTALYVDSKHTDTPFANLKVRQAISMAINRDAIVQARGFGYWAPVTQFTGPKTPYEVTDYPDSKAIYNVNKAKQLLAEAGYPTGFKTKIFTSASFDKDAVVFLQSQLAEVSIKADIDFLDRASFESKTLEGWNNAILVKGIVQSPNFGSDLTYFVGPGRTAAGSIWYPDDYLKALANSLNTVELDPVLFKNVNKMALDNMLAIPLLQSPPGAQPAWVKKLHDLGLYKEFEWIFNSSEIAWLER